MSFRMVCGLWVTPDFSEVEAGRQEAPRTKHSTIDYLALVSFFKELFPYGPPVTIRVPNDTIDQVTLHFRQEPTSEPTMRCEDFGKVLLGEAKKQKTSVIDIRASWKSLHILPDREFAPPPTVLPFVVTATDFEDAMLWHANTRPSLGLRPFDILEALNQEPMEQNGVLAEPARKRLEAIFGTPFEANSVLAEMYSDPLPAYAKK